MGKKRKSNPSAAIGKDFQSAFEDRAGSNLKLASWEDAMDSEDEFLANREKTLLEEGPDRKRSRKLREDEALLEASDEEILDFPSSDEESDDDQNEYHQYEVDHEGPEDVNIDTEFIGQQRRNEEDELEGWGASRRDLYGDDELETEADALAHEAEARRIQMKQLADMDHDDFGFEDAEWNAASEIVKDATDMDVAGDHILEILPETTLAADASTEERLKMLRERYPEFEPLKQEFLSLQGKFLELQQISEEIQKQNPTQALQQERPVQIRLIQYQALSAYLGTLAMYFALLTSTGHEKGQGLSKAPIELRDHDIMEGLVRARTSWLLAKDLKELTQTEESDLESSSELEAELVKPSKASTKRSAKKVDATEVAKLASDARRAARLAAVEEDFADLDNFTEIKPLEMSSTIGLTTNNNDTDSDLGDDTELNAFEAAAKAAKRKSLRFYTSQITQKAMKRSAKGREVGGDTDIPYREKWKQRQARLEEEASRRKDTPKMQMSGKSATSKDEDGSDSDGYQSLVSRAAKHKADKKKAAADAYVKEKAVKQVAFYGDAESIGPDRRKINRQIEKNKGLAPHRQKDVRNPRVKKRKKFEEKKKKIGSIKQVYKGGPGKGGYAGELTGIKTGLVKGIKLS